MQSQKENHDWSEDYNYNPSEIKTRKKVKVGTEKLNKF